MAGAALVAACSAASVAPALVRPTLEALGSLGLRCGPGIKDNVPSGLYSWSCNGDVDGVAWTVLVNGNDLGVAEIILDTRGSTDPAAATAAYHRLTAAVPPLRTAPALADAVAAWTGSQHASVVDGVRITAECDATQCIVDVVSAADPLRPLPLP